MKIIAGKYKNRVIPTLKKADYRPSTTKFREALFSILSSGEFLERQPVIDAEILDLFSGTGALSFEALSRGAANVTLVDKNSEYLQIAKEFASKIGEENNFSALNMNATSLLKAQRKYNLVFMDPPYYKGYVTKTLKSLDQHEWITNGAIIAIEMESRNNFSLPEHFTIAKEKKYGNNKLIILEYEQN